MAALLYRLFFQLFGSAKCRFFLYGLLIPLAFAPFHWPEAAFISLACVYWALNSTIRPLYALGYGFLYGLGMFGFGVSWIFVSIHLYGQFNIPLSALMTLLFISFLALYPALFMGLFVRLNPKRIPILSCLLFAALWTLVEYLRAHLLTGFPWLLIGFGQIDSLLKDYLPWIGVFGTSFVTALIAAVSIRCILQQGLRKLIYVSLLSILFIIPFFLSFHKTDLTPLRPLSVAVIQNNIAMRDKWDENLFWNILESYKKKIKSLYGTKLIVLPESALPLPAAYIQNILNHLSQEAKLADSAILLGMPEITPHDEESFYNALISLGHAKGVYYKQHLVPFGEYIPKGFASLAALLDYPTSSLKPGKQNQALIRVHKQLAAVLICYELAYGHLLRQQLPQASYIVSISDNGWFGHSLAMYQQQQMAQVDSLKTYRYQIMANNDGLSSIIDTEGRILRSLPPFTVGILKANILPNHVITPWVRYGNGPILNLSGMIFFIILFMKIKFK